MDLSQKSFKQRFLKDKVMVFEIMKRKEWKK